MSMWDHLIEQAVITLNLLRQSLVHPHLSVWAHYDGVLNYDATPMGPIGCRELIQKPVKSRSSWGFHDLPGYYVGPTSHRYRYFTVFLSK